MTKPFRGCRYEVNVYTPKKERYSHHSSRTAAHRAFREVVNNRQGMFPGDALVELSDVDGGAITILGREKTRP